MAPETPVEFWNRVFAQGNYDRPDDDTMAAIMAAETYFGNLRGRRLVDLGCGNGAASIWFAQRGAEVTAVDISPVAVEKLATRARQMGLPNLHPLCCDATELAKLGRADFIFGSMILHHLEPFTAVAAAMGSVAPQGFFYENSSQSRLLIWCRRNLVGRFGIPKLGDNEEFPLQPGEIDLLRKYFHVEQRFPEMLFLGLISQYLLRGRAAGLCKDLDRILGRTPLRTLSYRQYLYLAPLQSRASVQASTPATLK